MKVLRSWLEEYVEIPYPDDELADLLSLSGTAVESIEKGIDGRVIVVEIRKITPHPHADRLQLATVSDGKKEASVVCGAPNIKVGQKVPLAQIGAELPGGTIEKVTIRGIESEGMLCAADELGLGTDHSGIYILPDDYLIGQSLKHYIHNDTIFDLEITPNRGDCLSHFGIVREIAAISGKIVKRQPIKLETTSQKTTGTLEVEVIGKDICPQYQARIIENVEIRESPEWLKKKLSALGAKSINNIVDATNYITYDLGQPLHAFDAAKVGKTIIVRCAKKDEILKTLDGQTRKLESSDILITDDKGPLAIAGIMGGKDSEISAQTDMIILESAEFNPKLIRKTAKRLNLMTEASYRFERGIDSGGVEYALNKATQLIAEISGGKIFAGISRQVDKTENTTIEIKHDKINNLLGTTISTDQINHILKSLGFEIKSNQCTAPSWRHDIAVWQDLAEEIGRVYGYNKIKPIPVQKSTLPAESEYYYTEFVKDILKDSGFSEIMSYAFLSEDSIKATQLKSASLLEVTNPLQSENKYLRNSLIPNLMKAIAKNPSFDTTFLFEIGHIFTKETETNILGLAAAGKDAKTVIEDAVTNLGKAAGIKKIEIKEIARDELNRFKIRKPLTYVAEIPLSDFAKKYLKNNQPKLKLNPTLIHYRPVSKFPSLTRDMAFIVDKKVLPVEIIEKIYSVSNDINRVELFDEFVSDKFGKGMKNIAFHLYLQQLDKTMTDEEADITIKKIVRIIEKKFNAKLRS